MSVKKREWRTGSGYQVSLVLGGDRYRKLFETKAAAREDEARVLEQHRLGTFRSDAKKMTIGDMIPIYIEEIERRNALGKRMTTDYMMQCKGYVANYIVGGVPFYQTRKGRELVFEAGVAHYKLSKFEKERVEQFHDDITGTGAALKTVRSAHNVLVAVLDVAVHRGLVAKNVARGVRIFAGRNAKAKAQIVPPSPDVVAAIIEAAGDFGLYVQFAAVTGLLAGEQRGLRWENVDLLAGEVNVHIRVDRKGEEDGQGTKTGRIRKVPLDDDLLERLKEHNQTTAYSAPEDLVFPSRRGTPLNHDGTVKRRYNKAFNKVLGDQPSGEKAYSRPRWHDLRHFAVSLWIASGSQPKEVQEWAGHESLLTTMDIYGHLFPSPRHRERMNEAANLLWGSMKKPPLTKD